MAKTARQTSFAFSDQFKARREHGGDVRSKRRKLHRPLVAGMNHHLVLRSERARGAWSFTHHRNRSRIEKTIYTQAKKQGVRIDRLANVGNHLHLIVLVRDVPGFKRFLKAISGLIPRIVTGAKKGRAIAVVPGNSLALQAGATRTGASVPPHVSSRSNSSQKFSYSQSSRRRFWDGLAYTRLVTWGRELGAVRAYLGKNRLEAIGFHGARLKFRGDGTSQEAVVVVGEIDVGEMDFRIDPSLLPEGLTKIFSKRPRRSGHTASRRN